MTELLDQSAVQAFIDDRFGDRASEVTRLSGGDWSQAYADSDWVDRRLVGLVSQAADG